MDMKGFIEIIWGKVWNESEEGEKGERGARLGSFYSALRR
jgi:hypothetical protein